MYVTQIVPILLSISTFHLKLHSAKYNLRSKTTFYTVVYTSHLLTILNSTRQNTIYSAKQYFIRPFTRSLWALFFLSFVECERLQIDLARSAPAFIVHAPASWGGLLHCARGQGAMNSPPNNRGDGVNGAGRTRLQSARGQPLVKPMTPLPIWL